MQTVWKYYLRLEDDSQIIMPYGAEPLFVGMQDGGLCVWMKVDTQAKKIAHMFHVRGTGHPMGDAAGAKHIGSVFDRQFVWHVFHSGEVDT
jgi:hypothetical protein